VTEVEFRLLGAMQLRVDGWPVKLPGAAERGLLALLLLSPGRTVAASSLIDRLWSESALPADPLNALQLRVSKLRRALGAHGVDVVVREASGYRADVESDRVDVHRFVTGGSASRCASVRGHVKVPAGGHEKSPLVASESPHRMTVVSAGS
jgi:DNA-binding SARP family transcriptional activator